MILHTVIVSYQRLELLKRTVDSYKATVTVPHRLVVMDNGSDDDVLDWLAASGLEFVPLGENHYPGYACNRGFALAGIDVTALHRSDNDMEYLPGWCDAVQERLGANLRNVLVGLRTDSEELDAPYNTGGTAVIRRDMWDKGLRYSETPWEILEGMTEDYWICRDVVGRGYRWTRVTRPCVVHIATGDWNDPYYARSYGIRGIPRPAGVDRDIYPLEEAT